MAGEWLVWKIPGQGAFDILVDAIPVLPTLAFRSATQVSYSEVTPEPTLNAGLPDKASGRYRTVLANILAAPLIEMAPALVRRVAHHGRLVLSGIPLSVEHQVGKAYRDLGMHLVDVKSRAGWVGIVLQASW